MELQPLVSCLCITHNRVEMFMRAKECFHLQTYKQKELVVLFENDIATEFFLNNHPEYNYFELAEDIKMLPSYFIEVSEEVLQGETFQLKNGLEISLRDIAGSVLTDCNDGVEFIRSNKLEYNLIIDNCTKDKFRIKYNNYWLNINNSGICELTSIEEKAYYYWFNIQLDTSISLEFTPVSSHNSLEKLAWTKIPLREVKDCNINFYRINSERKMTLGMKRNLSIEVSKGEYVCVWDDDDWYSEARIFNQMSHLQFTGKYSCTLAYQTLFDFNTGLAYYNYERSTGHENSLLFKKEGSGHYGNLNVEEDTPLLLNFYNKNQLAVMEDPDLYIYNYHKKNTCTLSHFKMYIGRSTLLGKDHTEKVKEILSFVEVTE